MTELSTQPKSLETRPEIVRRRKGSEIKFANKSEKEFADILSFYQIEWEYEPVSFPIEWDQEGKVVRYFTPDFYLPEFDLYIELTTMDQRLVTKKNQKLRLLRSLYPEVNIKLFYKRDFHKLLMKYESQSPEEMDYENGAG